MNYIFIKKNSVGVFIGMGIGFSQHQSGDIIQLKKNGISITDASFGFIYVLLIARISK